MMIKLNMLVAVLVLLTNLAVAQEKKGTFQPGAVWLDDKGVPINAHGGGILFFKDTWYWYGEHRVAGPLGNTAQVGVHVYASKDLSHWKDEGIALKVIENDTLHDLSRGCILERPKVIYNRKTRQFVMWFHLELRNKGYDSARAGVATADSPTGPFVFLKSLRSNAGQWPLNVQDFHKKKTPASVKEKYCGGKGCLPGPADSLNLLGRDFKNGQMVRDMNLFVDTDGTAYHLFASEENSTIHISQLTDDYLSYSGKYVRLFVERYMEAPTLLKTSSGKYFFIGSDCTGWAPNAARSARADNIFGPWTELGNPCTGADAATTFHSQGTFVLPVPGKKDAFIFMADRWAAGNLIDSKYIWLPLRIQNNRPVVQWNSKWDLSNFE